MNSASTPEAGFTLRRRLRSATRDAILGAAGSVFAAEGGTGARVEDIAARAGVAVGTVYNYFEDRAALVSALLEVRTHALFDALDAAAADASASATPFDTELDRFVAILAQHFEANRALLKLLIDEELHRGIDARTAKRRRTAFDAVLVRAERIITRGVKARAIRRGDATMYAALLVGMVRGVAMSALARHRTRIADHAGEIVRVFLNGAAR